MVSTSASSQPSPTATTGSGSRTSVAGSAAGPASARSAPSASRAATGAKMSRPWKVRDTSGRNHSGLASSTSASMPPSASAAHGSRPLSGPTSRPPGVPRRDAAPGGADARVHDRDVYGGRQVRHGLREHGGAPRHVARRHPVRDVDDPHAGRQARDHAVAGGDEPVGEPVVGREADPVEAAPCLNVSGRIAARVRPGPRAASIG